jgi:hypothetical protein
LSAACFLLAAQVATAQVPGPLGLGSNPGLPPVQHVEIQPTPVPGTTDLFEWNLHDVPFYFDPNGGPIVKWLFPPPGGWNPGLPYTIHEEFKYVLPPPPTNDPVFKLRDWHERIISDFPLPDPAGRWVDVPAPGIDVWRMNAAGEMTQGPASGLQTMIMGNDIWFTFDPIMPAMDPNSMVALHIWKTFQVNPNLPPTIPIGIVEWPTIPEPTSLVLAGLGGLAFATGWRRRRSR